MKTKMKKRVLKLFSLLATISGLVLCGVSFYQIGVLLTSASSSDCTNCSDNETKLGADLHKYETFTYGCLGFIGDQRVHTNESDPCHNTVFCSTCEEDISPIAFQISLEGNQKDNPIIVLGVILGELYFSIFSALITFILIAFGFCLRKKKGCMRCMRGCDICLLVLAFVTMIVCIVVSILFKNKHFYRWDDDGSEIYIPFQSTNMCIQNIDDIHWKRMDQGIRTDNVTFSTKWTSTINWSQQCTLNSNLASVSCVANGTVYECEGVAQTQDQEFIDEENAFVIDYVVGNLGFVIGGFILEVIAFVLDVWEEKIKDEPKYEMNEIDLAKSYESADTKARESMNRQSMNRASVNEEPT
eukprot:TRINITY_DN10035_c0_g1_i1.p1 TRINITY_DN10035_c0_g1~~TRINITY_DN10035_c0_g1_i1.p1  ORF type:complete len:357 (-),score=54.33 TRINITY_DN10035_c0_g1_i1:10-1080(-)